MYMEKSMYVKELTIQWGRPPNRQWHDGISTEEETASVGRKVRKSSLEKMGTFLLCIWEAFVIILSTLLLETASMCKPWRPLIQRNILGHVLCILHVECHYCEHSIIVGTFMTKPFASMTKDQSKARKQNSRVKLIVWLQDDSSPSHPSSPS